MQEATVFQKFGCASDWEFMGLLTGAPLVRNFSYFEVPRGNYERLVMNTCK